MTQDKQMYGGEENILLKRKQINSFSIDSSFRKIDVHQIQHNATFCITSFMEQSLLHSYPVEII